MTAVVLIIASIIIYLADSVGFLASPKGLLEIFFNNFSIRRGTVEQESVELLSKIKDQRELELENNALRAQFNLPERKPQKLLMAKVLSGNANFLLIDKGSADNILPGKTVIYKNILVGKVLSVSTNRAKIELVTSQDSKITAKTERGAQGIVIGQGGIMLLDNVTLSETLEAKDLVFSSRVKDGEEGILPDFLIGEITRVYKSESALFQQATVLSPLDFNRQEFVFIVL